MGNKLIYLLLTFILPYSTFFDQEHPELSESGQRHWKAATALLEIASTPDELSKVIAEFELVTISDSTYADTYYNLGKLYTKLGKEWGDECFDSAKKCFNKYLSLRPDEAKLIEDEIYIVESIRSATKQYRYKRNKEAIVGIWQDEKFPRDLVSFEIQDLGTGLKVIEYSPLNRNINQIWTDTSFDGTTLSFSSSATNQYNGQKQIYDKRYGSIIYTRIEGIYNYSFTLKGNKLYVKIKTTIEYYNFSHLERTKSSISDLVYIKSE